MLKHFSILKSERWHARRCLLLIIYFSVARCRGFTPYLVVSFDFSFNAVLWLVTTALARKKVFRDLTFSGFESRQNINSFDRRNSSDWKCSRRKQKLLTWEEE